MKFLLHAFLAGLLPLSLHAQLDPRHAQNALQHALKDTQASAVVLDVTTGREIASFRQDSAGDLAPGSTLKPFIAAIALRSGLASPQTRVECHGTLTVGAHHLNCSHPRAITIFDLQQAMAYSCNNWFAELARHMPVSQLTAGLREYGLNPSTTTSEDQRILLTLGVEGVHATPLQLANAYRDLARQSHDPRLAPVLHGMLDSVQFGMAHNAHVSGISIAGKTGTAKNDSGTATHGIFAGIVMSATTQPNTVLVITTPIGNGGDAASLAQRFLLDWSQR